MSYNLTFSAQTQKDISKALDYYDEISLTLGKHFEDKLLNTYDKIARYPHHYFNLDKRFRRININGFPYFFAYTIFEEQKEVLVVALFHQHISSGKIERRLK